MTTLQVVGGSCLIDDADVALTAGLHMRIRKVGSAESPISYVATKVNGKTIGLHRALLGDPDGFVVDHINGDGLDNRRVNLRICSHSENMQNRRIHGSNKCGEKGVYLDARRGLYRATIQVLGKKIALGSFRVLSEAAAAYELASKRYHGAFARLTPATTGA